ncbi:MAG: response regulator [Thermoflexales bacterium]|nr:response regulator [Thermoflexales bacterium]
MEQTWISIQDTAQARPQEDDSPHNGSAQAYAAQRLAGLELWQAEELRLEEQFRDKRVLVADNSEAVRSYLGKLLGSLGATVTVTANAQAGLAELAMQRYDLIVLELLLPDMDGLELLQRIRQEEDESTVVVLTRLGSVKSAVNAMQLGADGYFQKQDMISTGDDRGKLAHALKQALSYRAAALAHKQAAARLDPPVETTTPPVERQSYEEMSAPQAHVSLDRQLPLPRDQEQDWARDASAEYTSAASTQPVEEVVSDELEHSPLPWVEAGARLGAWLNPSLRFKITLPYALLAGFLAILSAVVISRLVVDSVQQRFVEQLLAAGRLAANHVVKVEREHLATLRLVANTEGLAQAVRRGDAEAARALAYPWVANNQTDLLEVLDRQGVTLLSLRRQLDNSAVAYDAVKGTDFYASQAFVKRVLAGEQDQLGDKFAGLVLGAPLGDAFYVAAPLLDGEEMVGVVLIGAYLDELTEAIYEASGADHATVYASDGHVAASTFPTSVGLDITPQRYAQVLSRQSSAHIGAFEERGQRYSQVFLPFEARRGADMAVLAIAMSEGYLVHASPISQVGLIGLIGAALLGVMGVGTAVARHITQPIMALARASRQVAGGNLDQEVVVDTHDEVGDLAQAFNEMVVQLRLGEAVRDIFGRAVSPEVSAALIQAVSNGQITLGGESRTVSILFCDIKDFTAFSEQHKASQVVAMLNEFFGAIYPPLAEHGGVVNKFGGDSTLAIFGAPIPQADHAARAVKAALAMQSALNELNIQRAARGQPPIHVGIGINTGEVIVGTVGAAERLEYTTIGDPVNVASRIEGLTRQFAPYDLLISQDTLDALGVDHGFELRDLGQVGVRGKTSQVHIYAVAEGEAHA